LINGVAAQVKPGQRRFSADLGRPLQNSRRHCGGRPRSGEAEQASRTSTDDLSSSRRGGLRSHTGAGGRTRDQLYAEARKKNIKGRSTMTKAQLEKALER
jgi:hypothetical protein